MEITSSFITFNCDNFTAIGGRGREKHKSQIGIRRQPKQPKP